jgi:hypothetical protein
LPRYDVHGPSFATSDRRHTSADPVYRGVARHDRPRRSSIHVAHQSLHAVAFALARDRCALQLDASPNVEIASPQRGVRSGATMCTIVSSVRAMRDECLPGLLIKVSPCLIESPLHLHALLLRPTTLLLRLNVWSPREHRSDESSIRIARWARPRRRLSSMRATDASLALMSRARQSPAWERDIPLLLCPIG